MARSKTTRGAEGGRTVRSGTLWALLFVQVVASAPAAAQSLQLSGYGLNVGTRSGGGPFSEAGFADFQRLRGMLEGGRGRFDLDVAYEHTLLLRESGAGIAAAGLQLPGSVGNWWDLEGTVDSGEDWTWAHRIDRLAGTFELTDQTELIVGRQVVSWASTLLLTPADPFTPFDPADPFREYRAGVDAVRLRRYLGPVSELDVVFRPTRDRAEDRITALVRGSTSLRGWDVSAWGGVLYDRAAGAVGLVGAVGTWAVRGEASLRDVEGDFAVRGTIGVDRRFLVAERDLYLVLEYQHEGFGAGDGEIEDLLQSDPLARGELQLLSRDSGAVQVSFQVHPLVSASWLTLVSVTDGSGLVGPGIGWSVGSNSALTAGAFVGWGKEGLSGLKSEFGAVPAVGYASFSFFF